MKHSGKLTTLTAVGAVALALLLAPSGARATGTTTTTVAPSTASKSTTTTSPSPTTPKPVVTTSGRWTVLVATFPTKKEAQTQLAQLKKLGFKHFHVAHVAKQYVVRERHLHHATATKLIAKLKAAGVVATESQ